MARVDMLDDDDDRAQLRGQPGEEKAQGVDATGRGCDGDDLESALWAIRVVQSGPRLRPPCISAARIFQKSRRCSKREACISSRRTSVSRIARETSGCERSA